MFPLSIKKKAGHHLTFNKGYVYYPVNKPSCDLPEGLKDRGEFHITIVEPPEVSKMKKAVREEHQFSDGETEAYVKKAFDSLEVSGEPQYIGLGKQGTPDGNEVYFIVVRWPEAQELRKRFGLGVKDLHITVGFKDKDIFNVPKDETTLVK